jgi:flagellar biosynthesis/type III secretory pathway protein FliH
MTSAASENPEPAAVRAALSVLPEVTFDRRDGNYVPAAANELVRSADALVDTAMDRVRQLNSEVDQAIEDGRQEGLAIGREEAQRELARELHRIEHEQARYRRLMEASVIEIAMAAAQKTIGVQLDRRQLQQHAAKLIKDHMADEPYAIYIANGEQDFYRDALRALSRDNPGMALPVIEIDPRLSDGRAILRTRLGTVDLDTASQIEAIRREIEAP